MRCEVLRCFLFLKCTHETSTLSSRLSKRLGVVLRFDVGLAGTGTAGKCGSAGICQHYHIRSDSCTAARNSVSRTSARASASITARGATASAAGARASTIRSTCKSSGGTGICQHSRTTLQLEDSTLREKDPAEIDDTANIIFRSGSLLGRPGAKIQKLR